VVTLAALFIPICFAVSMLLLIAHSAASFSSNSRNESVAIPVIPTPIRASFSVTLFHTGLR